MDFNRTRNAKRNITWGLIMKIFSLIIPFLMRTIIIYALGTLYLGLNSLFASILNALNLAELGIGSALVFSMYKPIVDDDKEKICALMYVYKMAYYVIGIIVLVLGLILLPFLHSFINGDYPSNINIEVVYILQLLTTVAGYFFMAYKGSLLQAYQRVDIVNKLDLLTSLCMYIIQIIGLAIFKNYYVYVIALLFKIIVFNLIQSTIVDSRYPDLKAGGRISKEDRNQIIVKTGALMGHKVAGMVINSVDNILISMFMGLEIVAVYNNYFYVITALSGLFLMLTSGLNAIVGNYIVQESEEKKLELFNNMHYIICFAICFCCTCLIVLFQPFMTVWTGEKLLLPFLSVVLFTIYFFSIKVRTIGLLFKDASGLWEKDVLKAWLQIVIDLVIDLWLLQKIGINGAIISTIISMIFAYFYETNVIFRYCLRGKKYKYYLNTILYALITCIACLCAYVVCSCFSDINKWLRIPVNFVLATFISCIIFCIATSWTREFRYATQFVKRNFFKGKKNG